MNPIWFLVLFSAVVVELAAARGPFQVSIEKPLLSAESFRTGRSLRASRYGHRKFTTGVQNFTDYTVRFDTACADVWVIDETCTDVDECDGWFNSLDGEGYWKQKFHRSQSKTFKRDGRPLYLEDENSVVQGRLGVDTAVVGGIRIEGQVFGMVDQLHGAFSVYPFDGVVGLGWPSIAAQDTTPVFQNMLAQLEQPVFSIWLDRHVQPPKDRVSGVITFGAVDRQNCDPPLVYASLVREAEWIFNVDAVDYADLHNSSVLQAVSDTSSSLILVPFEIFPFILRVIDATYDSRYGLYAVPCASAANLPDLVLTVGGQQLHVPGTEYVVDIGMPNGMCALLMDAQSDLSSYPWVLGEPFLRTFCTIYDVGREQLGFAESRH